jgi:hypothetical protein
LGGNVKGAESKKKNAPLTPLALPRIPFTKMALFPPLNSWWTGLRRGIEGFPLPLFGFPKGGKKVFIKFLTYIYI